MMEFMANKHVSKTDSFCIETEQTRIHDITTAL